MCPPNKMVYEFADAIAQFIMNNQFEKAKDLINKEPHNNYFIYLNKVSMNKDDIDKMIDESVKQAQGQQFLGLVVFVPSITDAEVKEMYANKTYYNTQITSIAEYIRDQGIEKNTCLNTIYFNKFGVNKEDKNLYYLAMYYKRNALFVCNQGMHRSKTAAEMFNGQYAGIYSEKNPLTAELLENAEIVYVMEEHQRDYIAEHFPKQYMKLKILNLDIPDIYNYNDNKLKELIKSKINKNNGGKENGII